MKQFFKILSKTSLILLLTILVGILVAFYALQLPSVQTKLAQRAAVILSAKLGMPVTVEHVEIKWLDKISLKNLQIKDLHKRDMIAIEELFIDCSTNFAFGISSPKTTPKFPYRSLPQLYFKFNDNLDYLLLKQANIVLIREKDGDLNLDKFINKIDSLLAGPPKPPNSPENNTAFTIDNAAIEGATLTMQDPFEKRFPKEEFDQYNFTLNKLGANLKKVMLLGDTVAFQMHNMQAIDYRSQLEIKELNTHFLYCNKALILDKLLARINNSTIRDYVGMRFKKPSEISDFNEKVHLEANFKACEIDAKDLARFAPSLYQYKELYHLKGLMKGTVHDFKVENFGLKFGKNSFFEGNIAFKNLPDLPKALMDFTLKASRIDCNDTKQYVGEKLYNEQVAKFGIVDFFGTFKGLYNDFQTNAHVQSSNFGEADGNITMKIASNPKESTYTGDIRTENLELGKITNDPELFQKLSMTGKIEGKGLSIKDALLNFNGHVRHVGFDGYDYKQLFLDGKMSQSLFEGRVSVKDTNIIFDLNGSIDFSQPLNHIKLKGNVGNANLLALGYSKNNVKLSSEITMDFRGNQIDNLLGKVRFLNTILSYDKKRLGIDSLFLSSDLQTDEQLRRISIESEFLNGEIIGNFLPSLVIKDLRKLSKEYYLFFGGSEADRNKYYALQSPLRLKEDNYALDYSIHFKDSKPLFAYFFPEIAIAKGTVLGGQLNIRNTAELSITGMIDTLRYGNNIFYNSDIDINTSKERNSSKVLTSIIINSAQQKFSNMASTENLTFSGAWSESNGIDFDCSIKQQNNQNKAQAFGTLKFNNDGFDVSFKNTKLDILGRTWELAKDNNINFRGNEIIFQDISLSEKAAEHGQKISLNGVFSADPDKESTLDVQAFDLQAIKPLTNIDLKGIVNGHLSIKDIYHNTLITSQLQINNLAYKNVLIGDINGEALWDQIKEKLNISANVRQENKEIFSLSGNYDPKNTNSPINLKAELKKTKLEIFGPLVEDIFSDINGSATGALAITGTIKEPAFRGSVDFDQGALKVNALNTFLYFDDKMIFNEEGFIMQKDFEVRDAETNGNIATLEGGIYYGGSGNFMVNIDAFMAGKDGFKIMNTTIKDNQTFFGVGMTTGNINLSGPFSNLNISANLTSKKNTKLTIMMDDTKTAKTNETDIEFISATAANTTITSTKDSTHKIDLSGIKMDFNFTITPDAECEVIFDRNLKDQLNAFGNGRIAIDYDTRGRFTMAGPFVVKHGTYNYSFQGISSLRKFNIQEGSNISWNGDPLDADMDLRAVYTTNVQLAGIPGIQSNNSTGNSSTNAQQSNRYPVNIAILLKDKMLKPTISFDIKFDAKQTPLQYQTAIQGFENRLREDEQLMNKNLATLILANRFFPEDNALEAFNAQLLVDNLGGIISNQVGSLANKLDQNLDLGVQLGTLKQNIFDNMRVNVGYKLLNNRLRLGVNSTFLNTQTIEQINNNQFYYGGEVEWALSEDGTWRMKAYSKSVPPSWVLLSSGNVIMNGISLQYTHNFNYLFRRKNSKYLLNNTIKSPNISANKLNL